MLKLADFLQKLPDNRFDYNHWVGEDWKGRPDLSCGTVACALGWSTAMPSFRKLGAYIDFDRQVRLKGDPCSYSYTVAHKIFGLEYNEYEYLFTPNGFLSEDFPYFGNLKSAPDEDATAKDVAKHIRKFVAARYETKK